MNITTRIRKIEDQVFKKRTKRMKMVVVEEINGKYYVNNGDKPEEIALPENDADTNYVILKSYYRSHLTHEM